jgi:hypothetical protein
MKLLKAVLVAILLIFTEMSSAQTLSSFTVAKLPSAVPYPGLSVQVTDGTTTTDCTVGGGIYTVKCTSTGGVWVGSAITAPPANDVKYVPAAVSDSGTAYAGGLTRYDNNEPQVGSVAPATSALGYLAFQASPTTSQYAEQTIALPPYWTGTTLKILFYSPTITSGNVEWEVQSNCTITNGVVGSATWGTPATVTTAVSSTLGGLVTTASVTVAANGVNGCPAVGATSSSIMTYRIFRAASDTALGNVNLLGITLSTSRTQ